MSHRSFVAFCSVLAACLLLVGCGGLQIRNESVVRTAPDPQGGTRVHVTFEVWEGDTMVHGLPVSAFKVYEDGQPATSESINDGGRDDIRPPVVLVLDTSYSMYQARAIPDLKRAASKFQETLAQNGFEVFVYRFANRIEPVHDIAAIPESFDDQAGERFTSLYAAVMTGFEFSDDAVVVAFSDGADNYSQNYIQVPNGEGVLDVVEGFIEPKGHLGEDRKRVVHTIALGEFEKERDRDGVEAGDALDRISKNGTVTTASNPGALDAVFAKVAERIRSIYIVEFLSPSAGGVHSIQLEVSHDRRKAKSRELPFVGGETYGTRPPRRPLHQSHAHDPNPGPSQDPFEATARLVSSCERRSSFDCNKLRSAVDNFESFCRENESVATDASKQGECRDLLRRAQQALRVFEDAP